MERTSAPAARGFCPSRLGCDGETTTRTVPKDLHTDPLCNTPTAMTANGESKRRLLVVLVVLVGSVIRTADGYSDNAGTCFAHPGLIANGMGGPQNTGTGGYALNVSASTWIIGTDVTVQVNGPTDIKGLLLYASTGDVLQGTRVGSWANLGSGFKTFDECPGTATITHETSDAKPLPLTFTWQPPSQSEGAVTFYGVVALTQTDWYIMSSVKLVEATTGGGGGGDNNVDTPASGGAGNLQLAQFQFEASLKYGQAYPKLFWKLNEAEDTVDFAFQGQNTGWLGFGFSETQFMIPGYAIVFGIHASMAEADVVEYTLTDRTLSGVTPLSVDRLTNARWETVGGITTIFCTRSLKGDASRPDITPSVDLRLIWAQGLQGAMVLDNHLLSGQNEINLQTGYVSEEALDSNMEVLHGGLMTLAFAVLMPIGAHFARYEKTNKYCLPTLWYRSHLCMQLTATVAFVAGFCVAYKMTEDALKEHYAINHAIVGLALFSLACFQVFLAMIRCDPEHRWRWVFNIVHRCCGFAIIVSGFFVVYTGLVEVGAGDLFKSSLALWGVFYGVVTLIRELWERICPPELQKPDPADAEGEEEGEASRTESRSNSVVTYELEERGGRGLPGTGPGSSSNLLAHTSQQRTPRFPAGEVLMAVEPINEG